MGKSWRWVLVGSIVTGGNLLLILGIGGFQELLEIGKVPAEMLGRKVSYTTVSLFLGLAMIIWTFIAGIPWAQSRHDEERR